MADEFDSLKQKQAAPRPAEPARGGSRSRDQDFSTIKPKTRAPWLVPAAAGAGALLIAALFIGPQLLPRSGEVAPPAGSGVPPTSQTTEDSAILLEQARLLSGTGKADDLAMAIRIASRIPASAAEGAQAQSLAETWAAQVLQQARTEASGGNRTAAIRIAAALPAGTAAYKQAQQDIAQWRQAPTVVSSAPITASPVRVVPPPIVRQAPAVVSKAAVPAAVTQIAPQTMPQTAPQVAAQTAPQTAAQTAPQTVPTAAQTAPTALQPAQPVLQAAAPSTASKPSQADDPYLQLPARAKTQAAPKVAAAAATATAAAAIPAALPNSYGFQNLQVNSSSVAIELRDNVAEDGDYVTLIVNGRTYLARKMIYNRGNVAFVKLQPGQNLVEIVGDQDGGGGITLEVNVAGVGNVNRTPIPQGARASFIIVR